MKGDSGGRMGGNGHQRAQPIPFAAPAGPANVPIVGQRFQIQGASVPANVLLQCCCATPSTLEILNSVEVVCPHCQTGWNAAFNPMTKNLELRMRVPDAPKDPA